MFFLDPGPVTSSPSPVAPPLGSGNLAVVLSEVKRLFENYKGCCQTQPQNVQFCLKPDHVRLAESLLLIDCEENGGGVIVTSLIEVSDVSDWSVISAACARTPAHLLGSQLHLASKL